MYNNEFNKERKNKNENSFIWTSNFKRKSGKS